MELSSYSIYVDKRPLRIAFLVNPNITKNEQIEAIIRYNKSKWGGRFNPIIFTNGKTIEKEWWDFLVDVDVDIIKSLVPLEDEILEKIHSFLSPYLVEDTNGFDENTSRYFIHIFDEGLSILPTAENVAKVSRSFIGDSKIVIFELDKNIDKTTKQFIKCNFGTYDHTVHIDNVLSKIDKKVIHINNRESLALAFKELSSYELFTYPIQICSLPNNFRDAFFFINIPFC